MSTTHHKTEFKFIFAWYDMWIGAFWDAKKRRVYIFPLPTLGFYIQLKPVVRCMCPECHADGDLIVTVDHTSQGTDYEYGAVFSFDGTGKCKCCGWRGDFSDSSV